MDNSESTTSISASNSTWSLASARLGTSPQETKDGDGSGGRIDQPFNPSNAKHPSERSDTTASHDGLDIVDRPPPSGLVMHRSSYLSFVSSADSEFSMGSSSGNGTQKQSSNDNKRNNPKLSSSWPTNQTEDKILYRLRTRIVATLGPASLPILDELMSIGARVFRLNFSHGTHEQHKIAFEKVRSMAQKLDLVCTVIADMQGPKLRIGSFVSDGIDIKSGTTFVFDMNEDEPGTAQRVCLPHIEIFQACNVGDKLLLDDGKLSCVVTNVSLDPPRIETRMNCDGHLSNCKGVNFPSRVLPLAALTDKDKQDLEFSCGLGVDYIALSFVQRKEDVLEAREMIKKFTRHLPRNQKPGVLVKIEKPAAVEDLESILKVSDAVMVARGDLGVECELSDVPSIQERIISLAKKMGKPSIVATQMLESMVTSSSPIPTRAELSDVTLAVWEGADAVMLSEESAVGRWPRQCVEELREVAYKGEKIGGPFRGFEDIPFLSPASIRPDKVPKVYRLDSICESAILLARRTGAKCIVAFTRNGKTARQLSRLRPMTPLLVLAPEMRIAQKINLAWGLRTVLCEPPSNFEKMYYLAATKAFETGMAKKGEIIIVCSPFPFQTASGTNLILDMVITNDVLNPFGQ